MIDETKRPREIFILLLTGNCFLSQILFMLTGIMLSFLFCENDIAEDFALWISLRTPLDTLTRVVLLLRALLLGRKLIWFPNSVRFLSSQVLQAKKFLYCLTGTLCIPVHPLSDIVLQ